jgi:DNA-binding transcriptional regulator YiaG
MSSSHDPKLRPIAKCKTADRQRWERFAAIDFRRMRCAIGTREHVAPLIGASVDSIGCWERGEKRVPAWALKALTELVRAA